MSGPTDGFALLRESLGVSRINLIFRVHGDTILDEEEATQTFDEVGQSSLETVSFLGVTEDSTEQAAPSAGQSGIVYKRSVAIARPAHLGALVAAKQRILDMIRGAATAGLWPEQNFQRNWTLQLRQPPLPSPAPLTTLGTPQLGCTCKKQPKLQTNRGSKQYKDHNGPTITNPTVPEIQQSGPTSQDTRMSPTSGFAT